MMKKIISEMDDSLQDSINSMVYDTKKYSFKSIPKIEISEDEWKGFIKPPPSNTAKSVREDLQELSDITRNRTTEQKAFALRVDDKVESIFKDYLEKVNLRYPEKFVDAAWEIYYPLITNIKYYFNRARPQQLAPKYGIVLDAIVTPSSKTPSYPSGHSVYGYILESILSEMYPLHITKFEEISEHVGISRKILGIHFQSDIVAARKVTQFIYPKIRNYLLTNNILYSD